MSETQKKVIATILKDLESSDEKVVLDALKRVKSKGDASVIKPLIKTFAESSSDNVRGEIKALLSQIKVENALVEIIESLTDWEDDVNEMLLFAIWNANLNASNYLAEVAEASCKGNYMVALEGLTVVENQDGPFTEEVLNDAKLVLNEYFNHEDEKADLIKSMFEIINQFEDSFED
jgi:HEAT repeat protein